MRIWFRLFCAVFVGAAICSARAQHISPDEALELLITHVDNNMDKIRSGQIRFTHTRQPTEEGKRVLPKLAHQIPDAAGFVSSFLYVETISGEMTFRGYKWSIQGHRLRDTSLAQKVLGGSAGGQSTREEGQFVVGYDGRRTTIYNAAAGNRSGAEIYDGMTTEFTDVRAPALYIHEETPQRWSEVLHHARQSGRLKVVRVEGEPGKRVFVLKLILPPPPAPVSDNPNVHWILHFAEEWGYMLRLWEAYQTTTYAGKTVTWKTSDFRVVRAQELSPGVWFPTETVEVSWSGEQGAPLTSPLVPASERRTTITLKEWNRPVSDRALRPRLPAGIVVYDRATGRYYREHYPLFGLPQTIGAVVILVLLGAFLWWRLRRATSAK
ncbi:MAG: hypothetical protein ACUVTY_08910 [Armatimonadota bacterium]